MERKKQTGSTAAHSILAGSVSGMASVMACHPFDVIRTRMQAEGLSTKVALQSSFRGGISTLFQGFYVPFMAQAVYKSVIFGTNTLSRQYIFRGDSSTRAVLLSGCIAGSVNAAIVAPVEIVRTHQILLGTGGQAPSIVSVVRSLLAKHGPTVLWSGLAPTVIRDGPGVGLYLLAFDKVKQALYENAVDKPGGSFPLWIRVAAGSCAGVVFWTWALPIDTVKTLIESSYRTTFEGSLLSHVRKQISVARLFRALPLAYMRGIPSATVTLSTYDLAMEWLQRLA